ncbi:hypothetical protein CEP04_16200 [Klebsiella pneumoniae]|uniref:hypothetical protein n=1 Tax=Klebsiella pneumoniae TaxID=573 RepID=UPI000B9E0105|nr:hypothetical protein [Klebsiella pneumoniae]OZJ14542.1 hypothetical protein CEP04_16200 [Klebsiella pneumoniae]
MSNVTKPTSKGKFDGAVDYLCSDEARFLVMRGDYSEADIIQASVSQDVIDAEGAEDFASSARYYQCWYKVSPIGRQEGYSGWHHPRDTPCRGAYFASVLQWD